MKGFTVSTALPHARQALAAATIGFALSFAAVPAFAQSPGGPHGMHGMHGGGGIDQMIPGLLQHAKTKLNLNTSQQGIWDSAVAQSKAAREAAKANRQQVKAAVKTELAKPEPDLAAVVAIADSVEQQNRTQRIAARNEWLRLYASLSTDQKGVVKDMLQKRLDRAESLGAMIREHMQAMHPSN